VRTHQGGGAADLLAGGVVLAAVARALELVLSLEELRDREQNQARERLWMDV